MTEINIVPTITINCVKNIINDVNYMCVLPSLNINHISDAEKTNKFKYCTDSIESDLEQIKNLLSMKILGVAKKIMARVVITMILIDHQILDYNDITNVLQNNYYINSVINKMTDRVRAKVERLNIITKKRRRKFNNFVLRFFTINN